MKSALLQFEQGFRVAIANRRAEAAEMVLAPGDAEGDAGNRHRGADQWLYVVSGEDRAIVDGNHHALTARTLLLIEAGERHEIRNPGVAALRTLNFYAPPAFDRDGDELPAGER